jgi:hypothetical protein
MTNLTAALDTRQAELSAAYDEAFAVARQRPTVANRRELKKAERALSDYQKQRTEDSGDLTWRNIPEMVAALDEGGWKISDSTAYEHRDQGKLRLREDGTITGTMASDYARKNLRKKDGTPGSAAGGNPQEEKVREEILRIRADRLQRELKYRESSGELIPRNQVEIELAERASNLRTYLNAVARSGAGRIVKVTGGDPQKTPELISYLLGMVKKALDNYSRPIKGFEEEED